MFHQFFVVHVSYLGVQVNAGYTFLFGDVSNDVCLIEVIMKKKPKDKKTAEVVMASCQLCLGESPRCFDARAASCWNVARLGIEV